MGAAILGEGGGIFTGCNVENASLGLTIRAERNACTTTIAQGERRIAAVAIYGGEKGGEAAPCGACREFTLEFADEALEAPLYFAGRDGSFVISSFQEDLPVPIPQLCRERSTCPKKRPCGRGIPRSGFYSAAVSSPVRQDELIQDRRHNGQPHLHRKFLSSSAQKQHTGKPCKDLHQVVDIKPPVDLKLTACASRAPKITADSSTAGAPSPLAYQQTIARKNEAKDIRTHIII